jgi:uncharacterized protein (DUF924 family)
MNLAPQTLLEFWFDPQHTPLWFNSTSAFDATIRERFEAAWEAARKGRLEQWRKTPEGALALVILLDQMPLNMYRGRPESFATEAQAREVAQAALEAGWDAALEAAGKAFLYMPFMHSEAEADQARSVALFEAAGLTDNLKWARHHQDLILRFGRFPHRNAILGRQSTDEELAYLDSEEAFTG